MPAGLGELNTTNTNGDPCDVFNNIFLDPLFYSIIGDSALYLTEDSPCIDAGDPSSPLDPDNSIADIGAIYYYQSSSPEISLSADSLFFNPIIINSVDSLSLTIYNVGTADLIIDSLVCGQYPLIFSTNWNPADSLIAPEGSLDILIYFAPEDTIIYSDNLCLYNNAEIVDVFLQGEGLPPTDVIARNTEFPESFILYAPNPNPFNSSTVLRFDLPRAANVELTVFDLCGRYVVKLADNIFTPGGHSITFDAANLPSGLYLVRFSAEDYQQTGKLLLIK